MSTSYNQCKVYEAKDVKTVEELLNKYSKTFNARSKEYHKAMLESHIEDYNKYGFTFVNHHDSITGDNVSLYNPNYQGEEVQPLNEIENKLYFYTINTFKNEIKEALNDKDLILIRRIVLKAMKNLGLKFESWTKVSDKIYFNI